MTVRRLLALPLLGALLAGCGIRATEVPTDFGAAPSRVPCTLAASDLSTEAGRGCRCRSSCCAGRPWWPSTGPCGSRRAPRTPGAG